MRFKLNTLYTTQCGVVLLIVKIDETIWACSRNYLPDMAKPDWDLDGKYKGFGPPGLYDICNELKGASPRAVADPDTPRFDWANNTERELQGRHRKKK